LERVQYEIQRFTSMELRSTLSDLLILQLFFKKLKGLSKEYKPRALEYRVSTVMMRWPRVMEHFGCDPPSMALMHYYTVANEVSSEEMKKEIEDYLLRYLAATSPSLAGSG
jgi:hypothetical protein